MYPFRNDQNDSRKYLYHYTTSNVALDYIFPNAELRLCPLTKTNDPKEAKDWQFSYNIQGFIGSEIPYISDELKCKLQEKCKVICFSRDDRRKSVNGSIKILHRGYSHPRMWAQYASNHTGVCLVFDKHVLIQSIHDNLGYIGDIYEGPVRYVDNNGDMKAFLLDCRMIESLGREKYLKYYFKKYHKTLLFEKLKDWQSEYEYRCVLLGSQSDSYEFCPVDEALRGVVLGADFPKDYEIQIIQRCKQYRIPLIKLNWHNGYPTPTTLDRYSLMHQSFA